MQKSFTIEMIQDFNLPLLWNRILSYNASYFTFVLKSFSVDKYNKL